MTKADLVDVLSDSVDLLNRATADRVVNMLFDTITGALKKGERVNISGFGTFAISKRSARTGRNPKTGESIQIAPSRAAHFKAGKTLKAELNHSE